MTKGNLGYGFKANLRWFNVVQNMASNVVQNMARLAVIWFKELI